MQCTVNLLGVGKRRDETFPGCFTKAQEDSRIKSRISAGLGDIPQRIAEVELLLVALVFEKARLKALLEELRAELKKAKEI